MNNYTVYKHIFPNNKIYIGITCKDVKRRWGKGCNYYSSVKIYNAIKKYGWDNIKHEILYINLTKEEAEHIEIQLIKEYKSNNIEYGYNICSGGKGTPSHKVSEETRLKISNSKKGKMAYKMTDEIRNKIRLAVTGNKNGNYGKKLKELHKSVLISSRRKKIIQYNMNREYIKQWDGIRIAGRSLKLDSSGLSACCKGRYKSYGGYKWEYQKL